MKSLLAITLALLCSGCAFGVYPLAVSHTLANRPPFDAIKGKIVTTKKVGYISRGGFDSPQEPAPDIHRQYYLSDVPPWSGGRFVLARSTKLLVTDVRHYYVPPFDDIFFQSMTFNAALVTIKSGPGTGIKAWTFWGDNLNDRLIAVQL